MAFKAGILQKYIQLVVDEHINCNNNSEAYLTDIVRVAKNKNEKVSFLLSSNHNLVVGINTQKELIDANASFHNLQKVG